MKTSDAFRRLLGLMLLVPLPLAGRVRASEALQPPIDRKAWMVPSPSQALKLLKASPERTSSYPSTSDYMRALERFPLYGERGWRANYLGRADLGFFGDPDSAEMGLRSMGNFIFVMSLLATDPAYDERVSGVSREHVLERARACLRYMTGSHVTGDFTCGDGKKWGDHWQSAWWTAKMALGAQLMWDRLSDGERAAVERVVTHEADRHLARKAPSGATRDTKSEENEWDTEVMATALGMFPTHPHAADWRRKLIEFYLNSLSAPQDATSSAMVDGARLSEQVYTSNIHSDFTIENHGAYHVCYMACPLHSVAWGRWALQSSGQTPPEAQLHHFRDVWEVLKPTFLERRFAYIEGKDWPRYAYGMYFIMPALVLLEQQYGDQDAREIEARRFRTFEEEQVWNGDGSFFGKRFTKNIMMDRQAEYETDCYANLALCYLMHRAKPPIKAPGQEAFEQHLRARHQSDESGFSYVRDRKLFASFAWRVMSGPFPLALFVPEGMDSACEWGPNNLTGRISVEGVDVRQAPEVFHSDRLTDNGFRTFGRIGYRKADGSAAYTHEISFSVDTKAGTAEIESRFVADADVAVSDVEGLRLLVASDFFNKGLRVYHSEAGEIPVRFAYDAAAPKEQTMTAVSVGKDWVNIDGRLGVIQLLPDAPGFVLRRSDVRNAPWGSLHFDALDCPEQNMEKVEAKKGDVLLHTRFLLVAGDADQTRRMAEEAASGNKRTTGPVR